MNSIVTSLLIVDDDPMSSCTVRQLALSLDEELPCRVDSKDSAFADGNNSNDDACLSGMDVARNAGNG